MILYLVRTLQGHIAGFSAESVCGLTPIFTKPVDVAATVRKMEIKHDKPVWRGTRIGLRDGSWIESGFTVEMIAEALSADGGATVHIAPTGDHDAR